MSGAEAEISRIAKILAFEAPYQASLADKVSHLVDSNDRLTQMVANRDARIAELENFIKDIASRSNAAVSHFGFGDTQS